MASGLDPKKIKSAQRVLEVSSTSTTSGRKPP